jgi:flagellar motor switch protein FliN/FliY
MLGRMIDISPPIANLVDLNESIEEGVIPEFMGGSFVKIAFRMEIGDLVDSEIMQLYPFNFAKELYNIFVKDIATDPVVATEPEPQPEPQPAPQPTPQPQPQPQMQQPQMGMAPQMDMGMQMQQPQMGMGMPMQGMPMGMPYGQPVMQNVNVQPAQFQAFSSNAPYGNPSENIDIIRDVPLQVTVELGRTSKSIQEILDFAPGTIIELDKIAGEPIDVLVNGKFVAKGEVVVIDESFGVKVTEIIR